MILSIPHPLEILYGGGTGLSCGLGGGLQSEALHGFFAGDTRVLSTYRLAIAGSGWRVLSRVRAGPSTAQWEMQNPTVRTYLGDLEEGTVHLRLTRRLAGALHDDLTITSFSRRKIVVRFSIQLDADFADLFEVKERSTAPRLSVQRVPRASAFSLRYERKSFTRGLDVTFKASAFAPQFSGTHTLFDLVLEPHRSWRCCVEAVPDLDGHRVEFDGDPHVAPLIERPRDLSIRTASILEAPFERGCRDLERLAIRGPSGMPFIAAGAPWFLALFGRDTLVSSMMASMLGPWHAEGALDVLAATQATTRDDDRDAAPGKIAHELRKGELARFNAIPHTPYYGAHDAPALFVLALWNAFRWSGDPTLVDKYLPAALAALRWCEDLGDEDGDGLLEYRTRSTRGYRNQGWKDAEDAIPHLNGEHADLPIATVELQGYWFAAQLAMAELLEWKDRRDEAGQLRESARRLQRLVEERFWMEDEGCYALALDGRKRVVRTVASNQGHLLWCGLPSVERARRVARRLLADDMFSGFGVRTISASHVSYNPLSYQLGSVWPHDNALIAAGFARYRLREEAGRVFKGVLDAAEVFEANRLPELFCGFDRLEGPPVPYEKANVPQAWAAAAPILAAQVFLGLLPDAANGKCHVSPWLPDWLPELEMKRVQIAGGTLDIRVSRIGSETRIEHAKHSTLELVGEVPAAPLWGSPIADALNVPAQPPTRWAEQAPVE